MRQGAITLFSLLPPDREVTLMDGSQLGTHSYTLSKKAERQLLVFHRAHAQIRCLNDSAEVVM